VIKLHRGVEEENGGIGTGFCAGRGKYPVGGKKKEKNDRVNLSKV